MSRENRGRRNQRAADYQRALARLCDQHPEEFAELYADERTRRQQPTTHAQAR